MLFVKTVDGHRRALPVSDEEADKLVSDGVAKTTYHSGIIEEVTGEYETKEMTPAPKKRRTRKKKVDESAE